MPVPLCFLKRVELFFRVQQAQLAGKLPVRLGLWLRGICGPRLFRRFFLLCLFRRRVFPELFLHRPMACRGRARCRLLDRLLDRSGRCGGL